MWMLIAIQVRLHAYGFSKGRGAEKGRRFLYALAIVYRKSIRCLKYLAQSNSAAITTWSSYYIGLLICATLGLLCCSIHTFSVLKAIQVHQWNPLPRNSPRATTNCISITPKFLNSRYIQNLQCIQRPHELQTSWNLYNQMLDKHLRMSSFST